MRALVLGVVVAAVVVALRAPALADGPSEIRLPGKSGKLQAFVWRPEGKGPFPALVYNHGSEQDPIVGTDGQVARFFTHNGFVVIFPYRRGAGRSEGPYWEKLVDDKLPDDVQEQAMIRALVAENDDVVTAIEWLRAQPFVDHAAISVAGCSFGGIHTLRTAERPLGLHAAVDFAGASMAWADSPFLRERLLTAVEHARIPVFFVQAENDFNTAPSLVLGDAMRQKKLPHRVKIYGHYGKSQMAAHGGFCMNGWDVWGADVIAFLRAK
jgi:dienelactone hydrolase